MRTTEEMFRASLGLKLDVYEKIYGIINEKAVSLADRFSNLLQQAHEKTGLQAVVLVDEYDKPLLNAVRNQELIE